MTRFIERIITLALFLTFSGNALAIQSRDETSFLFFGDWGTGTNAQYEVAATMKTFCATERCDFALSLGDNFYPSGVASANDRQFAEKFVKAYHPLNLVFLVSLGNHDYEGNIQAQIDYGKTDTRWYLPSRYYMKTQGKIDFFALDTENFDAPQRQWLKDELAKSTAPWKIAFGHHPIYSYGDHGDTDSLVEQLLPILQGKVHFYLAGHDHDLQVIERSGLRTIVSGAAAKTRPTTQGKYSLYATSELGFSHFKMSDSGALLKMVGKNKESLFQKRFLRDAMELQTPQSPQSP